MINETNQMIISELTKIKSNLDNLTKQKEDLTNQILDLAGDMFFNSVWKDYDNMIVYAYNLFPDRANTYLISFTISMLKNFDDSITKTTKILVTPNLDRVNMSPEKIVKEVESPVDNIHLNSLSSVFAKSNLEEYNATDFFTNCANYFTNNLNKIVSANHLGKHYTEENINLIAKAFKEAHDEFINAISSPNSSDSKDYLRSIQNGIPVDNEFIEDLNLKNKKHLKYKLELDLSKNLEKYKKHSKIW